MEEVMEELIEHLESADNNLPVIHQFGVLMSGVIAGFVANKLARKAYKSAFECYKLKKASTTN